MLCSTNWFDYFVGLFCGLVAISVKMLKKSVHNNALLYYFLAFSFILIFFWLSGMSYTVLCVSFLLILAFSCADYLPTLLSINWLFKNIITASISFDKHVIQPRFTIRLGSLWTPRRRNPGGCCSCCCYRSCYVELFAPGSDSNLLSNVRLDWMVSSNLLGVSLLCVSGGKLRLGRLTIVQMIVLIIQLCKW